MEYLETYREIVVSIPEAINRQLINHLIRGDNQEDLSFALYTMSEGSSRVTFMIHTILLPQAGERKVHGNVSFYPSYFERVYQEAMSRKMGVAFLHSHPFPGWQDMSDDDVAAELKMTPIAESLTGYPLLGLTVGNDGTWSARVWEFYHLGGYRHRWVNYVKVVGEQLKVSFNEHIELKTEYRDHFKRTVTVWGQENHQILTRLRIGIIGLGSVGALVAEQLARMGCRYITLIDFDTVETHNLDRLLNAGEHHIGELKVVVAKQAIETYSTSADVIVKAVEKSLSEVDGYRAALDCDVLFSCVDRPWPRQILNHLAYAHLIPVIDGGIGVKFKWGEFFSADWQVQTIGPNRPCLHCLEVFNPSDAELERLGMLDNPVYMKGLPDNHHLKNNENVFPFSMHLASMEVFHLIALVTGVGSITDLGIQRFRYVPNSLEQCFTECHPECSFMNEVGNGDRNFPPTLSAEVKVS